MMLLMQGRILIEGPVSLFPSVSALINILLHASRHVVYVVWTQLMVLYDTVAHSIIMIFLGWLQIRPCIRSMKYCNHIVPN